MTWAIFSTDASGATCRTGADLAFFQKPSPPAPMIFSMVIRSLKPGSSADRPLTVPSFDQTMTVMTALSAARCYGSREVFMGVDCVHCSGTGVEPTVPEQDEDRGMKAFNFINDLYRIKAEFPAIRLHGALKKAEALAALKATAAQEGGSR